MQVDVTYSVMRIFPVQTNNAPVWILYDHWLDLIVAYNNADNNGYSITPPDTGWIGRGF